MHFGTKFILWFTLTIGIQAVCIGLYGVYEAGMGPYQCGFIDAGHYCGIIEYIVNKGLIANLALGIPTIISGVIAYFAIRAMHPHGHI